MIKRQETGSLTGFEEEHILSSAPSPPIKPVKEPYFLSFSPILLSCLKVVSSKNLSCTLLRF